jgi:hypothetical protein
MGMKSQLAFLFWVAFAGTGMAASEPMLKDNPLKNLPSEPGTHIAKIKAMQPGSWLDLGSPAADPKWGRARGRSWGGHALVPAPEFRGAMFTGEGPHGYVKPDGYGMAVDGRDNGRMWVYKYRAEGKRANGGK